MNYKCIICNKRQLFEPLPFWKMSSKTKINRTEVTLLFFLFNRATNLPKPYTRTFEELEKKQPFAFCPILK